jgi:light-regulated signal transduction histidine kinase (bacteriophytochrome)
MACMDASGRIALVNAEVERLFGYRREELTGQQVKDLELANENLETFAYSVAHDLRAPLRALSGFSKTLLEDYGDALGEEGRDYAGRIVEASEQMAMLIDDLLRLSRMNLMENAWKFTSGQDDASIEFGANPAGDGRLRCYVRDDGAGFDPACSDQLPRPFRRLHDGSEFPGTGVGLASVRQIVQRHGGRVGAEGAIGKGAAFHFTITAEEIT